MTLGNKFPESLIRIDYTRYCCYYRFRAELRNSIFLYNHKDALVGRKRVWQFPVGSLSNSDNSCNGVSLVSHYIFLQIHKVGLVSAQLLLDGM